jgi:pyrroline-5-carboxylate reductase
MQKSLALVGCGKMGQALLRNWLNHKVSYDITVIQPDMLPDYFVKDGYRHLPEYNGKNLFDIIVFAIKPQVLHEICTRYKTAVHDSTLIVSIAAGKKISMFTEIFGAHQSIIRTMPNTPASIGHGLTALCSNSSVTDLQKDIATNLFRTCGETVWIENENMMDAVTAISGSGPAYLFYLIECLSKAAQDIGFSRQTSDLMARKTIQGAAALAAHEADQDASVLRQNVTSPGGTTEAALEILMNGEWQNILTKAVYAAEQRGKELNK